jgi:hypothetical protein
LVRVDIVALNEFLRVLGELITRIQEVPAVYTERLEYVRKSYPTLTEDEQYDLAALSLDKLALYTRSVFSIEASILRSRLKRTVKELEQSWKSCYSDPFDLRGLSRMMKPKYPWKGYETVGLLESFREFLTVELNNIVAIAPWLPDLCNYEIALYRVRRSMKEAVDVFQSLQINAIQELKIEEFFEILIVIPQRVIPLALSLRVLDEKVEEGFSANTCLVLVARDSLFSVRTVEVTEAVYRFFLTSERQQPMLISEFAQVVLQNTSEEPVEQFSRLYTIFKRLLEAGCFVALSSSSSERSL